MDNNDDVKLTSTMGSSDGAKVVNLAAQTLPKPIEHRADCGYNAHAYNCTALVEGNCGCSDQCSCGAMTTKELYDWLDMLRPSRVAQAQAVASSRARAVKRDMRDADV